MIRVKICGVNDAAAFDAAAQARADWIGFVFFAASPRYVTPAEARALSDRTAGGPQRVGLFVNPTDTEIAATLGQVPLDALQLHATAERAAAIRARFGLPVWRALGVSRRSELPRTAEGIDGLLIEAKPPPGATRPGGNAIPLDWRLLQGWKSPCPWLLAGGLRHETVGEAIKISGATAVDVSSGVETQPGIKDPGLIATFIAEARKP